MKKIVTIIAVIVCLAILSRCAVESPKEGTNYNTEIVIDTIEQSKEDVDEEASYSFEYSDIHFTHSPNESIKVSITYPQFKDEKLSTLNSKIEEYAKTNFKEIINGDNEDSMELSLEEKYEIKLANQDLISIASSGELTKKDAAYPSTIRSTLNINPIDFRKFKITELININSDFLHLFRETSESDEQLAAYLSSFRNAEIQEKLQESNIYFGDKEVVIIFSVPHALGDYIDIKFDRKDIESYLIKI